MIFTGIQKIFVEKHFNKSKNRKIIEDINTFKTFIPANMGKQSKLLSDKDVFADTWSLEINEADEKVFTCLCGRKIKKQYLMKHKNKMIEFSLGSGHYVDYCNIKVREFERIKEDKIAYQYIIQEFGELIDEDEWQKQQYLMDLPNLPKWYYEQLSIGLPLLEFQMKEVRRKISPSIIEQMNSMDGMGKYPNLSNEIRKALLAELRNGRFIRSIDELEGISYEELKDRIKEKNKPIINEINEFHDILDDIEPVKQINGNYMNFVDYDEPNDRKDNGFLMIRKILESQDRKTQIITDWSGWRYLYDETKNIRIEYVERGYDILSLKNRFYQEFNEEDTIVWIIDSFLHSDLARNESLSQYLKRLNEYYILDSGKIKRVV